MRCTNCTFLCARTTIPRAPAVSHNINTAVELGDTTGDPIVAHKQTMAMHVKLEFGRNRSGVIAQQQQQPPKNMAASAATSHASGGNAAAVLPAGGTPPTSCAVDDYFKVSVEIGVEYILLCRRLHDGSTPRWVPIWQRCFWDTCCWGSLGMIADSKSHRPPYVSVVSWSWCGGRNCFFACHA